SRRSRIIQPHGPIPFTLTTARSSQITKIWHESSASAIYFADPYSAYRRGSNERVNFRIRRYLPKNFRFSNVTQRQLDQIVEKIDVYPRKCLGYRSLRQEVSVKASW